MSVLVTKDILADVLKSISEIAGLEVNVGIVDPKEAVVGYTQEYGSPAHNIPPQPFLEPGIEAAQAAITKHMGLVLDAALAGKAEMVEQQLAAAGKAAVVDVKDLAPVHTGNLRDSITYVLSGKFEKQSGSIKDQPKDLDKKEG
jgi:hypothetical protein